MNNWLPPVLITIAAILMAAIHMITPESLLRIDSTTLLLLVVAALPWLFPILLPFLESIKIPGGIELKLRELEEKMEDTERVATRAQDVAILGVIPSQSPSVLTASGVGGIESEIPPGPDKDDPWKDQFGGTNEDKDKYRRLEATVTKIPEHPDWFSIHFVVASTASRRNPLSGYVKFFLHPTFTNHKPVVPVGTNGRAELSLVSYGAFTVGVLADGGKTKLELDLSELPDAPSDFRER